MTTRAETAPPLFQIIQQSSIPKYIQLADKIAAEIQSGKIMTGRQLMSINDLSKNTKLSRDTIEKAYKILRERGLIFSVKGIGNFAAEIDSSPKIEVMFLINKPSSYKMEVYNTFVDTLGAKGHVSMYLYYCDENLFINALKKNLNNYNYFVIMPHFRNKAGNHINYTAKAIKAVETIPKDKVIILDNSYSEIAGNFAAIYQDFKLDTIDALHEGLDKLKKYKKIILVYPTRAVFPYPTRVLAGFIEFCEQHQFDYEILNQVYHNLEFESKEAYIVIEDNDLVLLIQQIRGKNLIIGVDVGVISYNETPLKELLGITVISTDFTAMGRKAAEMIINGTREIIKNPFHYLERNSI